MPQVLLVNPSARKGASKPAARKVAKKGKTMAKKARTAAQKRATAKLVALNKARRSGGSRPARKSPRRKARRASSAPVSASPAPRRRRARRHPQSSAKAASSAGRVLRYRRRNPAGGIGEFFSTQLVPSAIGGGGALLLDVALAVLPIPATMKVGAMAPIVRIAGAVGIGALAGMVTNRKTANQIAAGALTVTMYQIARGFLARALPAGSVPGLSAPDDGMGYINSGVMVGDPGELGEYVSDGPAVLGYDPGMGEYVSGAEDGMGAYEGMDGWDTGVYR